MLFDLDDLIPSTQILEDLTAPFTIQVIDDIIKKMLSDKAPRPDGFNDCFIKSCQHIIKEDFYRLCQDFYDNNITLDAINTSVTSL